MRSRRDRSAAHSPVPFLLFLLLPAITHAAPPRAVLDESHRTFLREHCTACHNADKQKGKVRLDDISFVLDDIPTADLWQKVLNSVNSGEMPPEDEPQPADEAKAAFLDALSGSLVTAREVLSDVEGRITMRRLNRREYKNTLRDLLGVAVPAGELPADGGAGTFDTVGSSLFMSSDQFEQYLALGRQAVDEHFARFVAPVPGKEWKLRIEVEGTNQRIQKGFEERTDARRRYLEWTTAVDAAADKPENAALADRIRAEKKDDPRHLHAEWQRIQGAPSPTAFGFTDAVHAEQMGRRDWDHFVPHHRAYLEHPLTKTGTFLTIDDAYVNSRQIFQLPGDWPAGDYILRVRIAAMDGIPRERRFVEFGPQDPSGVCTVSSTHEVTGTAAQPQVLEIPLKLTESKTRLFMFRERGSHDSDAAASRLFAEAKQRNGMGPELALWIDWIEVVGKASATLPADKPQKLRKDPEQWANHYMPIYAKGYAEKYERFQKWCAAIDEAAKKPENAEVVAKLRADPRLKTQPHLFYNGFAQIQGAPAPSQFGFRDVDDAQFARSEYTYHHQYYADYAKLPARDTGTWLMLYSLGRYTGITASEKWPAGRYTLRIRLAASDESPKERRFIEIGTGKADAADFNALSSHQVTGTLANPQTLEIPVTINATGDRNFAIRDKRPNTREAEYAMFREAWDKTGTGPRPCIWVDFVELEGPLNAMSAQPVSQSFKKHLEPELESNKRVADQHQRLAKRFDEFKRWAAAMDAFAQKPEHQQAVAKLPQGFNGWRRGIAYYQGVAALPGAPSAKDFGFLDMSSALFDGADTFRNDYPYLDDYLKLPHKDTGSYLTMFKVNPKEVIRAEASWPAGRYTLRIKAAAVEDSPPERRFIEVGHPDPGTRSGPADDPMVISVLKAVQVTGTLASPQIIEIPVELSLTGSREFVLREKRPNNGEASVEIWREHLAKNKTGPKPAIWIDHVELEGPQAAEPPAITSTIRQRREVELHANAMVGGTYNGYFKGGHEAAKTFLETGQPQKGIPDEQEAKFRVRVFEEHGPSFERYLDDPLTKTGAYLTIYNVHTEELITLPPDQPSGWLKTKHEAEEAEPGEYVLRFRIGAVKGTPKERHFVELGSRMKPEEREDFTLMQTFQISGTTDAPQTIEVPLSISAGGPRSFVVREKRDVKLDFEIYQAARKETKVGPPSALWIDWVEWEGPFRKSAVETLTKTQRIQPESRRADVERGHLRYKYLNEQYAEWQAAGADEARLKEFDFTDKSHAEFAKVVWDQNNRWFQQYLDRPLSRTGLYLDNTVQETSEHAVDLPADLATGDYVMRVKIGRVPGMPEERAFLSFVEASPIDKDDRTFLANTQITAPIDAPEVVELPFRIRPGGPRKFILMEKRPLKKEAISLPGRTRQIEDPKQRDPVLWIDWIEWEGPVAGPGSQTDVPPVLFPGETEARAVLERFAARAFRGKTPSAAYLDKLTALHDARVKSGDSFDQAIREPLSVILASPGFLYIQEIGTKESGQGNKPSESHSPVPIPLSQPELASRLSYFLWSAPPDDALLEADLTDPGALAREVDRLIASPKADEFVSGFVHQWLHLDRLDFFQFDTKQFRDFDESAKAAARREVYETFAHLLRNGGSLSRLLKSDEVHVNGLLATYYGIEGVSGDEFRPVKVPEGSPRGGLLGMAAVLAMGSNGERTSPVERGTWVLRYLLHHPPPPAPPNVPQLDRLDGKPVSPRDRLLAHQEEPQCLQCHRKIDPIGFGLENFNAAGKWREVDYDPKTKKEWPIDPAGALHNGPAFKDYFELRDLVAARSDDFARGFTEALIEYGLGRPYGFTDDALASEIVARAKEEGFVIRGFIQALAASEAFGRK